MSNAVSVWRWTWLGAALLFALCVALKLNGSSVGMWSKILGEPGKPPGLLLFHPQTVRSDEWQIWTPSAVSQARQNPPFPLENPSLGAGRSPMIFNLPIAYYTTCFRPQLWGFFLFDLERGFSWCWSCKVFGLLLGFAWLLSQLGLRPSIVALGTLWLFFSGYVQWWFSSPVMLPEMLASWAICVGCLLAFFRQPISWRIGIVLVLFVLCGINFALCLYPAYQVPLFWLTPTIAIGSWLEGRRSGKPWFGKRGLFLIAAAILLIVGILLPFWNDARATLEMVAHTQYPGMRRASGGDLSLFKLWSGCLSFFQTPQTLPKLYENICEGSNFFPLWPALLGTALLARWRPKISFSPMIIALGIFTICLSAYCVVPFPKFILRPVLLDLVTERRALFGLGVANILLCCVFFDRYRSEIRPKLGTLIVALVWLAVLAMIVFATNARGPGVFPDLSQVAFALAGVLAVVLTLSFERGRPWSLMLIVALLVVTNLRVNPVMTGLGPLLRSEAFQEVDRLRAADPAAKWIVYRQFMISELVLATGAPVMSGNKVVPDLDFLHQLDPSEGGDKIYDRYGYVYYDLPENLGQLSAQKLAEDLYVIYVPPDLPSLQEMGVRYLVFPDASRESELYGFTRVYANARSGIFIYQRL